MLDIVVCDDNRNLAIRIKNVVEKFMFNSELQYDIKVFNDYNKEFYDYINIKRGNIIYILDMQRKSIDGSKENMVKEKKIC